MKLSGTQYQCVAGETYDSVALAVYGDEAYACEIMNANPFICTLPMFTGGEVLDLPVVEIAETDSSEVYMPAVAPWKE